MSLERLLVVDDSDANILFFEMLLKDMGFSQVFTAKSGVHGLEQVEKETIELIVVEHVERILHIDKERPCLVPADPEREQ